MRRRNHVQRQELGQHLGVELVGLPRALGDHPQLLRVGQHDAIGQRFDQLDEPLVAARRLDDHLERS